MDWKQFVSAVVGSLAWPASIVVVVLLLKAPLAKLLPKIRTFKYGGLHIDLEQQLADVKAVVTASEPNPLLPVHPTPPPITVQLAAISPRSAVLMAWLEVEKKIDEIGTENQLASQISPIATPKLLSPNTIMRDLWDKGRIDELTYTTFRKLNHIRNDAAHMTSKEIEFDEAISMAEMCQWLIKNLEVTGSSPS